MKQKKISYQFDKLDFTCFENKNCAVFMGKVFDEHSEFHFKEYLSLRKNGEWTLQRLVWNRNLIPPYELGELTRQLVNKAASLLYPINMWTNDQNENGANLFLNQKAVPENIQQKVAFSSRPQILSIPASRWEETWPMIINRLNYDDHFNVQGFIKKDIEIAIEELKSVFPCDWIQKQYKHAAGDKNIIQSMGMDFPSEFPFWYPAYHLSRTAIGAICIDPGWIFLVELGLAINSLKDITGIDKIKNSLTKHNGNQHCICLANDLYKRGLLVELEPLIGNGPYKNDITINFNNKLIDIESKVFTSNKPEKALSKEIQSKINNIPSNYDRPLIFYSVYIANGVIDREKELIFYNSITNLSSELSDKITAVVGGKLFIDSSGGHIKRDSEKIAINPNAKNPLLETDVKQILQKNYSDITYPIFGLGTLINFSNQNRNDETI